jgi:hypothetical protein
MGIGIAEQRWGYIIFMCHMHTSIRKETIDSIKNSPAKKAVRNPIEIQLKARSKQVKSPITNLNTAPSILAEFVQTK